MPLPTDEALLKTAGDLLSTMRGIFNTPSSYRPAHARGTLLRGTFTPTPTAAALSTAPHFNHPTTPITVRFSSSTGIPSIPDTDPSANPRGIAIRFHLGPRTHTDIIAHSTPYFPTRTGGEFLAFLRALVATQTATVQGVRPSPIEEFLGAHPAARRFAEAPKPSPVGFGTETYWGVNAFWVVGGDGGRRAVRWRVVPVGGEEFVGEGEMEGRAGDYLVRDLEKRMGEGGIAFRLVAQVAQEGDVVDDATQIWPEERELVELGRLELDRRVPEEEAKAEQKYVIFDPIPRVEGVEASDDPLLEMRAALYLISGRERRKAEDPQMTDSAVDLAGRK